MPITFRCGGCGRESTVADDRAGGRMRCAACGHVCHVPTFIPNPNTAPLVSIRVDDDSPTPRPGPGGIGGVGMPIAVGLAIGCAAIGLMFAFRDQIHEVAPALMPERPPAPLPDPPAPARPPEPAGPVAEWKFEPPTALGRYAVLGAIVFGPILLPAACSRLGALSLGRWIAMAGCCVLAGGMAFGLMLMMGMASVPFETREGREHREAATLVLFVASLIFGLGGCGCLFAAAIHPKPKV